MVTVLGKKEQILALGRSFTSRPIGSLSIDDFMEIFFLVFVGLAVMTLLLWIFIWARKGKEDSENAKQPIMTMRARVIQVGSENEYPHHCVFECEDSVRRKLTISKSKWENYIVGDIGTLTFQGTEFKKFELEKKEF